jgi:hypothetical protein
LKAIRSSLRSAMPISAICNVPSSTVLYITKCDASRDGWYP